MVSLLSRQTAINANQIIRENTEGFVRPYVRRSRLVRDIVDKHKESTTYDSFLLYVMDPSPKVKPDLT